MTKPYPSCFPPSTKKSLPYLLCSLRTNVLFLCGFLIGNFSCFADDADGADGSVAAPFGVYKICWHDLCNLYSLYIYALCQRTFFVQDTYIPKVYNVDEAVYLGIQGEYA